MKCCTGCFSDRKIVSMIKSRTRTRGRCDFCEATEQLLIEPSLLSDEFEGVIGAYLADKTGSSLKDSLMKDWRTFSSNEKWVDKLLLEIIGDRTVAECLYVPLREEETLNSQIWEELREDLQNKNRFFPEHKIDGGLQTAIEQLVVDPNQIQPSWFRARIEGQKGQFPVHEMGAPPARISSGGRANPVGIPYLYIGSSTDSVIAEVRPHPGHRLTIAEFQLKEGLRVVDLRDPVGKISPFSSYDSSTVRKMRGYVDFVNRLAEELAKPVIPANANIDYVPTQFICEYIKKWNFDGVLYASTIGQGLNLVLFNTGHATPVPQRICSREVKEIDVKSIEI